ncbi:hypothetical protein VTN00DRAFT_3482 [Thermoascus crustaceus]|uniref:uncharacterized protein n=1 Tax=Thermoascus crustaceus TaxID=5088 RepID=UPI0037447EE2
MRVPSTPRRPTSADPQAPTRPNIRQKAAKAASGRGALPSTKPSSGPFADSFKTTKKDKRLIKHSAFVSKIEKANQKTAKRRRASKKLVANLDALADALPDAGDDGTQRSQSGPGSQVNIIRHRTLKHRPGAMKRKEKLEKMERDRFVKNMAQLVTGIEANHNANATTAESSNPNGTTNPEQQQQQQQQQSSVSSRFAALRNFISQTMEQQPVFKNK